MSPVQPSSATPAFRDQSTGLMIFGAFQILLGCLCGLMALMMIGMGLMPTMPHASPGQAANVRMMIPAAAFYLVLGAVFIWLGVGSIRARRWAWALTVVSSWLWLIMGVAGCVVFAVAAGPMMSASMAPRNLPPGAMVVMHIVVLVIMACIYVLLPAVFLAFYQRASVRATCQWRDPRVRWTDRCPLPVLALSLMFAMSAVSFLPSMAAYGGIMPLFGRFVSGPAGAAAMLLLTLLLAYLTWGTYQLQMAAWWGTLLLSIAGSVNMVLTFSQSNLMEMYEKMKLPAEQLEMIRKSGIIESMATWGPWMGLVGGAAFLGYLLYVRRYFVRGGTGTVGAM